MNQIIYSLHLYSLSEVLEITDGRMAEHEELRDHLLGKVQEVATAASHLTKDLFIMAGNKQIGRLERQQNQTKVYSIKKRNEFMDTMEEYWKNPELGWPFVYRT